MAALKFHLKLQPAGSLPLQWKRALPAAQRFRCTATVANVHDILQRYAGMLWRGFAGRATASSRVEGAANAQEIGVCYSSVEAKKSPGIRLMDAGNAERERRYSIFTSSLLHALAPIDS